MFGIKKLREVIKVQIERINELEKRLEEMERVAVIQSMAILDINKKVEEGGLLTEALIGYDLQERN